MEGKGIIQETADFLGSLREDPQFPNPPIMKREMDSVDDFEHLSHDSKSPIKEDIKSLIDDVLMESSSTPTRVEAAVVEPQAIDKRVESAGVFATRTEPRLADDLLFDPVSTPTGAFFDQPRTETVTASKMDSNLLDFGDAFPDRKEADAKIDKFLNDMSSFGQTTTEKVDEMKDATLDFMEKEIQRAFSPEKEKAEEMATVPAPVPTSQPITIPSQTVDDVLEHYSDSEGEDDFKNEDFHADDFHSQASKFDQFKDVHEFEAKEQPLFKTPEPEPLVSETVKQQVEEIQEVIKPPTPVKEKVEEIVKEAVVEQKDTRKDLIEAEAMFFKMGLALPESLVLEDEEDERI